jgi:hypothetical protein
VYIKTHENISAYSDEHLYDDKLEIGISDGFVQNGSLYKYHAISVPKSRIKVCAHHIFSRIQNFVFVMFLLKKKSSWKKFSFSRISIRENM